jgi:hypothetical protein
MLQGKDQQMTELTIEHEEESIRKAAISVVTGIIAELECCGRAAPDLSLDHLEWFQRLLAKIERSGGGAVGGDNDGTAQTYEPS